MLTVREQIGFFTSDGRRKAYEIADAVFADVITRLRHDPRLRGMTTCDLELLLADARRNAERQLLEELRNTVHAEVVNAALLSMEGQDR